MFEFVDGFWYFVVTGAVFLAILAIANIKRADAE